MNDWERKESSLQLERSLNNYVNEILKISNEIKEDSVLTREVIEEKCSKIGLYANSILHIMDTHHVILPEKVTGLLENDNIQKDDVEEQKIRQLEEENRKLLHRAERDQLTGLYNRYGLNNRKRELRKTSGTIGVLMLDVDLFKDVNDGYGHDMGDLALKKVAHCLQKHFEKSALLVRLGGDEFLGVFFSNAEDTKWIQHSIDAINDELQNPQDEVPKLSVSAGYTYSRNGYIGKLSEVADRALYAVKKNGRRGCRVLEFDGTALEQSLEITPAMLWNHSAYGTDMYFLQNDSGLLINRKNEYVRQVLEQNHAVGIINGFYEDGYPVYSISGFALESLGYTYQQFLEEQDGKFQNLVYEEDYDILYGMLEDGKMMNRKIRLRHRSGKALWFNASHTNCNVEGGKQLWIVSVRMINNDFLKLLSSLSYESVGIISLMGHSVLFEKGMETIYTGSVISNKKYDYDDLVHNVLVRMHKSEDWDRYFQCMDLGTIEQELKKNQYYEFQFSQIRKDGKERMFTYQYRYMDAEKDAVLWTRKMECEKKDSE